MSEDSAARGDTPLALKLQARIRAGGPISLRDYMIACLEDDEHGYYRTRNPLGNSGDFVTAPEISQVFGELIGLWTAVVWQQMGSPEKFNLVELGPGRGTLLADALRATRRLADFREGAVITLVEPNPVLAEIQKETLRPAGVQAAWQAEIGALPRYPTILLANEVLDCFPIRQHRRHGDGWREVGVALDSDGRLAFSDLPDGTEPALDRPVAAALDGDVVETRDIRPFVAWLGRLAAGGSLAALFIDYGYAGPLVGDTFQAVRDQRYEHPLASPGKADLTAHVDFSSFARECAAANLVVDGPVPQAEFLGALGIAERASRLIDANPGHAQGVESGVARLMAPNGMGTRFKALGVRSAGSSGLPGFAPVGRGVG